MEELIKLIPFELDGKKMLDVRFWRKTKRGPRATRRGIEIEQSMIAPLIYGLQKVRSQISSDAAREEAGVR